MTDIRITDLSDGAITTVDNQYVWNGTGVFDVLMKAINGNIKVQYDNGNIDTSQYATVYLGAIQTAIQSAVDFLLREKLTEAQVDDVLKGTLLKQEQIDASKADTIRNDSESIAKIATMNEQINASKADTIRNDSESTAKIATMNEQINASQIEMSIKLDQAGKDLLFKEEQIDELVKKQELMQEQINASQIEVSLKIDQTAKELQVKDEQIASSQAETTIKQDGSAADIKLKAAQTDKLAADIDNVDAQRALYDRQRQGFDDNKYQKLLDTQINAWALMFSSGMLEASELPVAISGEQLTTVYELASGTTIPEGAVGDSTGTATTAG